MHQLPKGPSRFIPTLTEVIVDPERPDISPSSAPQAPGALTRPEAPARAAAAPFSLSERAEVVSPQTDHFSVAPMPSSRPLPSGFEEHLVHRVMQRVDVGLDQRLRDAIATVLSEQTRSLLPRLREEVESVVRHVVYEAVADELATDEKTEDTKS